LTPLPAIDPEEVAGLERQFGPCARRTCVVPMRPESVDFWAKALSSNRRAEVGMVILCPSGKILVHTKDFYPKGTFRIPTGGIRPDESVLDGLRRELWEETGLRAEVLRFLAVLEHHITDGEREVLFVTYLFLLRQNSCEVSQQDSDERIAEFREVDAAGLAAAAEGMERLPEDWDDWGRLRAVANRAAAELLG